MLRSYTLLFLILLTTPILAAPVSGNREIEVTEPVIGAAPLGRTGVRVASNGDGFVMTWIDRRDGDALFAARFSSDGTQIDPFGILVARNVAATLTAITSDGVDYLMAYDCGTYISPKLCAARMTPDGAVSALDFKLDGVAPALAWNGSEYLLVYRRSNFISQPSKSILAQRLSRSGGLVGSTMELGFGVTAAVASNGQNFFVAWTPGGPNEVRGLTVSGSDIGPERLLSVPTTAIPWIGVASDGDSYLVVFTEGYMGPVWNLTGTKVSAKGEPLVISKLLDIRTNWLLEPAIARFGSRYVITYSEAWTPEAYGNRYSKIRGLFVTPTDLSTQEFDFGDKGSRRSGSSVAANATRALVGWKVEAPIAEFPSDSRAQVEGVTIDATAGVTALREATLVSRGVAWQETPSGVAIGATRVVAWTEFSGDSQKRTVMAKRFGAPGRGTVIRESGADQVFPAMSASTTPLVVWLEVSATDPRRASAYARRISRDGAPLGAEATLLGDALLESRPTVMAIGTRHFIFWTSAAGQIVMSRMTEDGTLIDASPLRLTPQRNMADIHPVAASDGNNIFLAWSAYQQEGCLVTCLPVTVVELALISQAGATLTVPVTLGERYAGAPNVVWNGEHYVLFSNGYPVASPNRSVLLARRFTRGASIVDPTGFVIADNAPAASHVVWNGREYVHAYSRKNAAERHELFVDRFDTAFQLRDSQSFQSTDESRLNPFVIASPVESTLVFYQRQIVTSPYLGTSRITSRAVEHPARQRSTRR